MAEAATELFITLSLGSNSGNKKASLNEAIIWLGENMSDFHSSEIYETEPIGHPGNHYFNAVVCGKITGTLKEFEMNCKKYEILHGRGLKSRELKIVPIDLDIVTVESDIIRPEDFKQQYYLTGLNQLKQRHKKLKSIIFS